MKKIEVRGLEIKAHKALMEADLEYASLLDSQLTSAIQISQDDFMNKGGAVIRCLLSFGLLFVIVGFQGLGHVPQAGIVLCIAGASLMIAGKMLSRRFLVSFDDID